MLHVIALALLQSTAPEPSIVGDWRLNLARTHYGAGVDRRRYERFTCTSERDRVSCVIRSVRADGREVVGRFSAPLSGKGASVAGIPDVDEARQLRRPGPEIVDATFLSRARPVFGYRAMRADDGRSLLIISVDPVSRAALTTIVVYDRAP